MKLIKTPIIIGLLAFIFSSCVGDLNVEPIDPSESHPGNIGDDPANYFYLLNKLYAGFVTEGQRGDGSSNDQGGDQYTRTLFSLQVVTTDESVYASNTDEFNRLNFGNWTGNNIQIIYMWDRLYFMISLANEYIRTMNEVEPSEELDEATIHQYISEARYIRALVYLHTLDMFGNGVPMATEETTVGSPAPEPWGPWGGDELFKYIESELDYLVSDESGMLEIGEQNLGYADKGAAYMSLAKLMLNNEVYLGKGNGGSQSYFGKGEQALLKVLNGPYFLSETNYENMSAWQSLFAGDNHMQDNEMIFSISQDGMNIQTWGGTTYFICSGIGGNMQASNQNMSGAWNLNRTTGQFYDLFEDGDLRRTYFYTEHQKEIFNPANFKEGYGVMKYTNMRTTGNEKNDPNGQFSDVDFPMYRLADAYLMLAEMELRQGKAVSATASQGIEKIRSRVNLALPHSINLDFIIDERGRELFWECHRFSDLRRFDKFTSGASSGLWAFKGGVQEGTGLDPKYNWFPIPVKVLNSNPHLERTPGY